MRFGPRAFVLAGLVLLAVSAMVVYSGRAESRIFPSAWNTKPTGTAAFAELLKLQGYEVRVERSAKPKFSSGDTVILPQIEGDGRSEFVGETVGPKREPIDQDPLLAFVRQGGRVVIVHFSSDSINDLTPLADPAELTSPRTGAGLRVTLPVIAPVDSRRFRSGYPVWSTTDTAWAWAEAEGEGTVIRLKSGLPILNRFLGQHDNAAAGLSVVATVAAPESKVVFWEAAIGNVETPGLLGTLGGWAVALQWQLALLAAVVAYSLGRRFGFAEAPSPEQRSARDLVDAFGATLRRAKKGTHALRLLATDALAQCRSALRVPASAPLSEVLQRLPSPLSERLAEALDSQEQNLPQAVARATELARLLREFQQDTRKASDRLRRSK